MIVDTSAVVAIARKEPDAGRVLRRLREAGTSLMSMASFVELTIVLRGEASVEEIQSVLDRLGIECVAVDVPQANVTAGAYRRYGRGSGHPAKLNYGDAFTYALASTRGHELLFVGDDFGHTDLRAA